MIPASEPCTPRDAARLMVLQTDRSVHEDAWITDLPRFLNAGDLVIVNDAATLPASLRARTLAGQPVEIRLVNQRDDSRWLAVLFGRGDWRTPTEFRDPPPRVGAGEILVIGENFHAQVEEVSSKSARLVTLQLNRTGPGLWSALYAYGKPIQYSHLKTDHPLWSFQTVYATRPWAVEMPSAGEPLSWQTLLTLRRRGVRISYLTHSSGLSSTGEEELDMALPLPERFDIPSATVDEIGEAHRQGRRVVAIGTTVVRALEGSALKNSGRVHPGPGETDLVIGSSFQPAIVDALLTGIHEPSQSHFRILRAFTDEALLRSAWRHAAETGYLTHEFGDLCLILGARSRSSGSGPATFSRNARFPELSEQTRRYVRRSAE